MSDLRFRSFRMRVYARLSPAVSSPEDRTVFMRRLDEMDEDGIEQLLRRVSLGSNASRVLAILREARELGDRLNVMDRTLPALPHTEISECYRRLRRLGDEIGELEAAGALQ